MTDQTFDSAESGASPTGGVSPERDSTAVELGAKLFELRDYTPIPLIVLLLIFADSSVRTATLGTLLVVLGELIRIYGVAFIGSVSRTRNTSSVGAQLIASGPFALVRNPLYCGNFFISVGLAVFGGVWWLIALTILMFAFQYYCIVKYEEKLLLERFGAVYADYMQRVPAWIPTHLPPLDQLLWPDTFSPALKSERKTLTTISVILVLLMVRS